MNFQEAKKYIDSIEFSDIFKKLIFYEGWLKKDVNTTCKMYRNYLLLVKKYSHIYEFLPPSNDIDNFWHHHILDTNKYIHDCQMIFGKYLHHYPYFSIDKTSTTEDLNEAFEITQNLYYNEFGEFIVPTKSGRFKLINILAHKLSVFQWQK